MFVHQLTELIMRPPAETLGKADSFHLTSFHCCFYLELCREVLGVCTATFGLSTVPGSDDALTNAENS